jgi:hypothetical protein
MRILLLDTYYPGFLAEVYADQVELAAAPYRNQRNYLLAQGFGTSDFYSRHLLALGHEAEDLIVNCTALQTAWAREHGLAFSELAMRLPQRLLRAPLLGPWLSRLPGLAEIAIAQIRAAGADVLYCQDLWFLPPVVMKVIRPYVKLIVGQIASPLPPAAYLRSYDLITTSFPHFVPRLRHMGIAAEYFRIGFDEIVLQRLGDVSRDIPVSFVGGISRHHGKALPMLEYLAEATPIEFFGYGAAALPRSSPIRRRHHGEAWGQAMYQALARSRMTINRHIDVAENNANNMRLFEATGVGTLLITDRKDNLDEFFDVGKEVVAYSSMEEAAELVLHFLAHPDEAAAIGRAGQQRTLAEHSYKKRMDELSIILEQAFKRNARG